MAAKACRGLSAELAAKLVVKVNSNIITVVFRIQFLMCVCMYISSLYSLVLSMWLLQEALRASGLKDDTTCLVVDILPFDHSVSPPSPKKHQNKLRSLFLSLRSQNSANKNTNKLLSVGSVEELFEEGSAMLEERYVNACAVPFPRVNSLLHSHLCFITCLWLIYISMCMLLVKQK